MLGFSANSTANDDFSVTRPQRTIESRCQMSEHTLTVNRRSAIHSRTAEVGVQTYAEDDQIVASSDG